MKRWFRLLSYAAAVSILIFVDRASKQWALQSCGGLVITPWLSFDLALNRGISWGLFHTAPLVVHVLLSVLSIIIMCVLIAYAYYRWLQGKGMIGEMLIIAGASSNIYDRLVYGAVVDFMCLHTQGWQFPVFNVADIVIVLGVCIMVMRHE